MTRKNGSAKRASRRAKDRKAAEQTANAEARDEGEAIGELKIFERFKERQDNSLKLMEKVLKSIEVMGQHAGRALN